MPEDLPEHTAVDVYFQYGENGRLTVHSLLPEHGRAASLEVERASGLSEEQLQIWEKRIAEGRLLPEPGEPGAVGPEEEEVVEALFDESEPEAEAQALDEVQFDETEPAATEIESTAADESTAAEELPSFRATDDEAGKPSVGADDPELGDFLRGLP